MHHWNRAAHGAVPFFDWPALFNERSSDYLRIIEKTASSGGFILQSPVAEFERQLAASACETASVSSVALSGVFLKMG